MLSPVSRSSLYKCREQDGEDFQLPVSLLGRTPYIVRHFLTSCQQTLTPEEAAVRAGGRELVGGLAGSVQPLAGPLHPDPRFLVDADEGLGV